MSFLFFINKAHLLITPNYSPFDIFWKVVFYLALYTEEINIQTFVMIRCKTIRRKYTCTKHFILVIGFNKNCMFSFFSIVKMAKIMLK